MPIRTFLVVVLVLVIEKIKLVKPGANRIEDEDEDDIPARGVSPARHTQFSILVLILLFLVARNFLAFL